MTKADLVDQLATRLHLPKLQTERFVTLFWQSIMDALEAGNHVELRALGAFGCAPVRPGRAAIPKPAPRWQSWRRPSPGSSPAKRSVSW